MEWSTRWGGRPVPLFYTLVLVCLSCFQKRRRRQINLNSWGWLLPTLGYWPLLVGFSLISAVPRCPPPWCRGSWHITPLAWKVLILPSSGLWHQRNPPPLLVPGWQISDLFPWSCAHHRRWCTTPGRRSAGVHASLTSPKWSVPVNPSRFCPAPTWSIRFFSIIVTAKFLRRGCMQFRQYILRWWDCLPLLHNRSSWAAFWGCRVFKVWRRSPQGPWQSSAHSGHRGGRWSGVLGYMSISWMNA